MISIHAPRAGGDKSVLLRGAPGYISIHAPRAGGDKDLELHVAKQGIISIHAPRAGGDALIVKVDGLTDISIHAPRAGGDGKFGIDLPDALGDFNPRPPCGGRPGGYQIIGRT